MVKIAVAGGSGQVAREVIDALVVVKKHDIIILTRAHVADNASEFNSRVVNYDDKQDLVHALHGVHTILSFVQPLSDFDQRSQKNLIDAAIISGVRRFAPSEYGSKGLDGMVWWQGKSKVREYLEQVNEKEHVLEYTLFQPGLFLNYLAYPYKTSRHLDPLQSVFDFHNCRAIMVDGHEDAIMTVTTVADLAVVVSRAVDHEGLWPAVMGIQGNRLTFSQIIEIARRVRGRPINVEKVKLRDIEAGELKTSWRIQAVHEAVSTSEAADFLKDVMIGTLLSSLRGAWDISQEANMMFPDIQLTLAEDFLKKVWEVKP